MVLREFRSLFRSRSVASLRRFGATASSETRLLAVPAKTFRVTDILANRSGDCQRHGIGLADDRVAKRSHAGGPCHSAIKREGRNHAILCFFAWVTGKRATAVNKTVGGIDVSISNEASAVLESLRNEPENRNQPHAVQDKPTNLG